MSARDTCGLTKHNKCGHENIMRPDHRLLKRDASRETTHGMNGMNGMSRCGPVEDADHSKCQDLWPTNRHGRAINPMPIRMSKGEQIQPQIKAAFEYGFYLCKYIHLSVVLVT